MNIIRFCKNWTLPIAMVSGVLLYVVYVNIPALAPTKPFVARAVDIIQPLLIFTMLFLAFCKISLHDLRPCRWHLWLLLIQGGSFSLMALLLILLPHFPARILVEGAMLCMICPTATASAVVTRKLGGDAGHITTYIILANLLTSFLVPLLLPLVHPQPGVSFASAFTLTLGKVFPLLLCPFVAAILLRYLCPKLHARVAEYQDLSFYLWAVALTIAIAVTAKSVAHGDVSFWYQAGLAVISLVCCALQFIFGKRIGRVYGDSITAGQALGQKNTALAIWMGYTFFTPVTSLAAGFYSVWHNVVNSYQLYRKRKEEASSASE